MAWESEQDFVGSYASAAAARRFCVDRLRSALGVGTPASDVSQTAELVVSELVTNAVQACAEKISVRLQLVDHHVLIEVSDDAVGAPRLQHAQPWEERGRGLSIVEAVSSSWGVAPLPGNSQGKKVWVELVRA